MAGPRLRECNYGRLNRAPKAEIEAQKAARVSTPFPGGESYDQTAQRMELFLSELSSHAQFTRIMIIGHRATQYGLEHWLKGVPLAEAVTASWQWQPGWVYEMQTQTM